MNHVDARTAAFSTSTSRARRLAVAVTAAGIVASVVAGPAVAVEASPSAPAAEASTTAAAVAYNAWVAPERPWTPEGGAAWGRLRAAEFSGEFGLAVQLQGGLGLDGVDVLVRPAGADADVDREVAASGLGALTNLGKVSLDDIVAAVGEGPSEVRLVVDGVVLAQADLPDAEAVRAGEIGGKGTYHVPGLTVHNAVPTWYAFADWPMTLTQHRVADSAIGPAQRLMFVDGEIVPADAPLPEGMSAAVVGQPEHGAVDASTPGLAYVPEAGYEGTDAVAVEYTVDGVTKTVVYAFIVVAEGSSALPHEAAPTIADPSAWVAGEAGPAADAVEPKTPAEPSVPADPATPVEDVADEEGEEGEHAVPGKVQTGDGATWWLAGLGALGLGGLVTARRAVMAR